MQVLLVLWAVCLAQVYSMNVICPAIRGVTWLPHPDDCTTFFMCYSGEKYKYQCPDKLAWDVRTRQCRPRETFEVDPCKEKEPEIKPCMTEVQRDMHPGSCAKYFECPLSRDVDSSPVPKECPYPLLFDLGTQRCEFPETVECGARSEPKDPCEYESEQCQGSNCEPCHMRNPSCKGLPDGLNAWGDKKWTPWYTVCKDQRVVFTGQCSNTLQGHPQLFDPDNRTCREVVMYHKEV